MTTNILTSDIDIFIAFKSELIKHEPHSNIDLLVEGERIAFPPNGWKYWFLINKIVNYKFKIKSNQNFIKTNFFTFSEFAQFDFNITGQPFLDQFHKSGNKRFESETKYERYQRINNLKIEGKYFISPVLFIEQNLIWRETNCTSIIKPLLLNMLEINKYLKFRRDLQIEFVLPPPNPFIDDYDLNPPDIPYDEDRNDMFDLSLDEERTMNDETNGFWGFENDYN